MDENTFLILVLLINLGLCAFVGYAASQRNRGPWAWFFLSLLLSPLIAIIALLIIGRGTGTKSNPSAEGAADLSNLSDEEVATLQAHRARQTASRVALPKKLDQ